MAQSSIRDWLGLGHKVQPGLATVLLLCVCCLHADNVGGQPPAANVEVVQVAPPQPPQQRFPDSLFQRKAFNDSSRNEIRRRHDPVITKLNPKLHPPRLQNDSPEGLSSDRRSGELEGPPSVRRNPNRKPPTPPSLQFNPDQPQAPAPNPKWAPWLDPVQTRRPFGGAEPPAAPGGVQGHELGAWGPGAPGHDPGLVWGPAAPRQITQRARTSTSPGTTEKPATANPKVDESAKTGIRWFDDSQYFGLKASADMRFKIRHAPIVELGSPWPMPQHYRTSNVTFHINPLAFRFNVIGHNCEQLVANVRRIRRNIFGNRPRVEPDEASSPVARWLELTHVNISVEDPCTPYPYLDMVESYTLVVTERGATIVSREVWGALRAMETFSQVVYQLPNSERFFVNETYIEDFPRFKHRGLLLDTSRHFLDKETLLENLEAMAQNKLNVFHWHIVDDQSFPFQSKVFPNLTYFGAYDPLTHVYTQDDIAEIIEAARLLGIRVIPEFDSPGHTFSWGYGQNHLLTPCYEGNRPNGLYGPINPLLKKNYRFLKALFKEVMSVFKDKYFHTGGDEVPFGCWLSNPAILRFMKKNDMPVMSDVLNMYGRELFKILDLIGAEREQGIGSMVWQEMFEGKVVLPQDTVVQVWSGDSFTMNHISRKGYQFIFSTCWYLDYISYGMDWDKYYRCEQINMDPTDYRVNGTSLLIGGEVCMWLEYADDAVIMPRVWPRASAAAERLWSNRNLVNIHQAAPRMEAHRCRMLARGLKVGVASGPGHCARHRSDIRASRTWRPLRSDRQSTLDDDTDTTESSATLLRLLSPDEFSAFSSQFVIIACVLIIIIIIFLVNRSRHHSLLSVVVSLTGSRSRGLGGALVLFTVAWCVWTAAPVWTHGWGAVDPHHRPDS